MSLIYRDNDVRVHISDAGLHALASETSASLDRAKRNEVLTAIAAGVVTGFVLLAGLHQVLEALR